MATMRENSRREWDCNQTLEQINCGSLQRIAEATELMAKNWALLVADRDRYKGYFEREKSACERLVRRVNALRGAVTKAKKRSPR